jgi:glutamate dehydrogenase
MALSDPQQASSRIPTVDWDTKGSTLRCLVRWPGNRPSLSQVLPIFDQLGLRVADHRPDRETDAFLFSLEDQLVDDTFPLLTEAFVAAWDGSVDRDVFASLVMEAHLHARQVQLVRAAFQYLRQGGLGASRSYVRDILTTHRDFVRYWVESFEQRFEPPGRGLPEHDLAKHADAAGTRDEYRVLDWYAKLLDAITRTTYFRDDRTSSSSTIVLKLDPSKLPFATDPSVAVETFVHHPDVEGLHVRYGRVARGGLRWSDRIEDYRDEVLALARAQQVKNSLIVPAGAKGAFVVKARLAGLSSAEASQQVRRCYRLFVRGLLDITDDMSGHEIVPPAGVLVTDAADPYLVVAADKGTAGFSDLANAEAADAGFWLDDAFASGGSSGFDHKQLGVTARGAWVAVRRHFTELGIDPHTDEFTVVGIGDMSGDVFGNGMLRSDRMRLVAAFDHRHIFVDPHPDPSTSFAERGRLAGMPGSSWADYGADLISQGGGVFPRSGRSVRLSQEGKDVLGVAAGELSTDELVQAVLRAPVDLLWNGGIGTYVRASQESDADVADRGNDRVRVTADQLRCKVVGEGGNLGLSQAARIEFSLAGGRVNADFIDNVAGVNTSDREVNLKILLHTGQRQPGSLERAQRDGILELCAPDVVREVLADSERLTLAISVAEGYGVSVLDRHDQVIHNFEDHGLDRAREQLPDAEEVERRRAAGRGLTRPEIAVILARAKNLTHELLLEGRVPDDPSVAGVLVRYFPEAVRESYALQIPAHPLAREIIATRLANELIDRVGPGFLYRIEDRTGASTEQAVRSVLVAKDLLRLDALWDDLTPYPVAPTIPVRHALERVLGYNACWLVRRKGMLGWIDHEVDLFAEPVGRLHRSLAARPVQADRSLSAALAQLESLGAPQELLARTRAVTSMRAALALASAAADGGFDVVELERIYAEVGEAVNLSWLYAAIPTSSADPHWVQLAKAALRDELEALTVVLAADVLRTGGLAPWARVNEDALARVRTAYAGLSDNADVDVAMLTVGIQVLRDLCHALDA